MIHKKWTSNIKLFYFINYIFLKPLSNKITFYPNCHYDYDALKIAIKYVHIIFITKAGSIFKRKAKPFGS